MRHNSIIGLDLIKQEQAAGKYYARHVRYREMGIHSTLRSWCTAVYGIVSVYMDGL
jgi:hypothetical protein